MLSLVPAVVGLFCPSFSPLFLTTTWLERPVLTQAMVLQRRDCLYHNVVRDGMSLMRDHHCTRDGVPRHTRRVLVGHTDEVWCLAFSHSGHMLATASRCVLWWSIGAGEEGADVTHRGTTLCPASCSYPCCPLSSGSDKRVILWDGDTFERLQTLNGHTNGEGGKVLQGVASCAGRICPSPILSSVLPTSSPTAPTP